MRQPFDEQEFEVLWRAHYADVLAFALRRCGDPQVAADIVAETFLVAWRRRREAPGDIRPWLFGVARMTLANDRRRQARAHALWERAAQVVPTAYSEPAVDDGLEPGISNAFRSLSPDDQEALRLIAWDDLSPKEAAATLGIPVSRFSVRLHRARRRLRAALDVSDKAKASARHVADVADVGRLRGTR